MQAKDSPDDAIELTYSALCKSVIEQEADEANAVDGLNERLDAET